jgi:hypothetical protein
VSLQLNIAAETSQLFLIVWLPGGEEKKATSAALAHLMEKLGSLREACSMELAKVGCLLTQSTPNNKPLSKIFKLGEVS